MPGPRDRPNATDVPEQLRSASPRSDLPAVADLSEETDHLATSDHPVRWSKADLRQRLERLPPGHPSSLRTDELDSDQRSVLREPDFHSPEEKAGRDTDARREGKADRRADLVERDYWSEVSGFLRAAADHVRRWPTERAASEVDRSRDPDGSWRGDGARYLNPDQHKRAKEVIVGVRRTEEPLTEHMREAERDNACGGWLEGLELRLKGEDRLKEKIAERLGASAPDATRPRKSCGRFLTPSATHSVPSRRITQMATGTLRNGSKRAGMRWSTARTTGAMIRSTRGSTPAGSRRRVTVRGAVPYTGELSCQAGRSPRLLRTAAQPADQETKRRGS